MWKQLCGEFYCFHPASIGHSSPQKWRGFIQKLFRKSARMDENNKQTFSLFSFQATFTLGCVQIFCLLGGLNPLDKVLHTQGEKIFLFPRGENVLKHVQVIAGRKTEHGNCSNLSQVFKVSRREFFSKIPHRVRTDCRISNKKNSIQ